MALELDHVFICCSPGAPEAEALLDLGLREGSPNTHPGQGTANRRFFFANAYLELLWVFDEKQAPDGLVGRTRLWERWSTRSDSGCPFGLVFRPKGEPATPAPFATWTYRPPYLPEGLHIEFADRTTLQEPELVYLPFALRSSTPAHEPIAHALPLRHVLGVTITLPSVSDLSPPSQAARSARMVDYRFGTENLVELRLFAEREQVFDLRPALPLLFRGVTG